MKFTMEDALECIIDYRGKTPEKSDEGIPTLSAKSVKNGYIDYSECYYISEDEYKRFMVRGFPKVGDILLTTEAPMGMVARLDRDDVGIAQRLITLRGKSGILDNNYLMYYLQSPIGQGKLRERETGSTVTGIKQAEFRKIEIDIPDIALQKKISSILYGIDRKIECNKAINRNLQEQLDGVYLEHFMSEHNGILSDICDYSSERIAVSSISVENYYSTENILPNKKGSVAAASLPTTDRTPKCVKGNTLISNIRPYFKKILYCYEDGGCSSDVLCITAKSPNLATYVYSTLYTDRFFDYMVAGSKGTKMPRGDKQQIMKYAIHIPKSDELELFDRFANGILEEIHKNNEENKRLSAIRDTLLPKLISGELDVSDIDL